MGCTFRKAASFEAIPDNYNSVGTFMKKNSLLQLASYEESFFVIDKLKVIEKALGDFVVKLLHECPWSIPYTNHDNRYQKHKNKN
ncbi:hypothetical protein PsorP6_006533 [Peronosclerospora sorghi]|uniref:Uncharacterized protein n=1 Tax=Peronosclerospora sorghi TaxID=230839 RepID=A0ACC0W0X1_9STRA|nr:hypothetical protein PsorP6_006533 [Peronosclerospora sorghi]